MSKKTETTATDATTTGTEIATLPPAERAAIVLDATKAEEQLRAMVTETADINEVKDKDSRTLVHNAAMKLKSARVAIEKTGKAARDDANAFSKAVIAEENRLKAIITTEEDRLFKLRDDYDQQVEAEKQERERKERERVDSIKSRIAAIKALPMESANDPSAQLHQTIHDLTDFEIGDDFAEFKEEAGAAKWETIGALQRLWDAATTREAENARLQAEAERLAALCAEEEAKLQEERDKLAAERAELEAMRAELAAQKAAAQPQQVAEPEPEPEPEPAPLEPEVPEVPEVPDEPPCEPMFDLFTATDPVTEEAQAESEAAQSATDIVRELAGIAAMQFRALGDKTEAVGFTDFAAQLRHVAHELDSGALDSNLMAADWTAMANADKALALASHAGVALVFGDQEMGGSVLLQAAE